MVLSVRKSQ